MGGAWSSVGTVTYLSVNGSTGQIRLPSAGAAPGAFLGGVSVINVDTQLTVASDKAATGNGIYLYLVGRHVATNTEYRGRVRLLASGAVAVTITGRSGTSADTTLQPEALVPGLSYTPGTPLRARLRVSGTNPTSLALKVWPAASTEPSSWQVLATDSTPALQGPGGIGVETYLSGTSINAPVTLTVDDLKA